MDDPERDLAGGPSDAELAAHLRALRQAVGVDAPSFAKRAGLELEELRAIEGGAHTLTLAELERYADGLGMRLDTIIKLWQARRSSPARDE